MLHCMFGPLALQAKNNSIIRANEIHSWQCCSVDYCSHRSHYSLTTLIIAVSLQKIHVWTLQKINITSFDGNITFSTGVCGFLTKEMLSFRWIRSFGLTTRVAWLHKFWFFTLTSKENYLFVVVLCVNYEDLWLHVFMHMTIDSS